MIAARGLVLAAILKRKLMLYLIRSSFVFIRISVLIREKLQANNLFHQRLTWNSNNLFGMIFHVNRTYSPTHWQSAHFYFMSRPECPQLR